MRICAEIVVDYAETTITTRTLKDAMLMLKLWCLKGQYQEIVYHFIYLKYLSQDPYEQSKTVSQTF